MLDRRWLALLSNEGAQPGFFFYGLGKVYLKMLEKKVDSKVARMTSCGLSDLFFWGCYLL